MSSNMKLAMYVCSGPSGQNIVSKCIVSTVNCHKFFFGTLTKIRCNNFFFH